MSHDEKVGQESSVHAKRRAIILAFVIVCAAIAAVFILRSSPSSTCDDVDSLTVVIESLSTQFELFLPIPVEENGTPWYLVNSLSLTQGNATFSLVETMHGRMLSVEGSQNITISAQAPRRASPFYAVTPQNSSWLQRWGSVPFLVYLNASGRESDIEFTLRAVSCKSPWKYGTLITVEYGDLRNGWQEIWGDAYDIVW